MSFITINPTIDMLSDIQPSIFYLDDGTAVFKCITPPEGIIEANAGSLALQSNGQAWIKTTNGFTTGWILVGNTTQFASNSSSTNTSGTGLDNLSSLTIPANIFTAADQGARFHANGFVTGAAGNHRWVVVFDGVNQFDTGLIASPDVNWQLDMTGVLRGTTNWDVAVDFRTYSGGAGRPLNSHAGLNFNAAFTLSLAHSFQIQAECANGADTIFQRIFIGNKI